MALKYVMINDIIEEHNARMQNLRKYYPFFVLAETTFAQYKEGRYAQLDMGYITMAVLRFLFRRTASMSVRCHTTNMKNLWGSFSTVILTWRLRRRIELT